MTVIRTDAATYDVVVIGAGPVGENIADRAGTVDPADGADQAE